MAKLITLILVQLISWNSAAAFSVSRIESICRTSTIIKTSVNVLYSSSFNSENDASENDDENLAPPPVAADADTPQPPLESIEKAWRHAKKPLLRIGSKGFSKSHGNSLRQLLQDHVIVKVKLNTDKYGTCGTFASRMMMTTMTTEIVSCIRSNQNNRVFLCHSHLILDYTQLHAKLL
jgi:RNA-binding protein YhbY